MQIFIYCKATLNVSGVTAPIIRRTLSVCFVQLAFAISCQQYCPRSLLKFRVSANRLYVVRQCTALSSLYQTHQIAPYIKLYHSQLCQMVHRDLDMTYALIPKYTYIYNSSVKSVNVVVCVYHHPQFYKKVPHSLTTFVIKRSIFTDCTVPNNIYSANLQSRCSNNLAIIHLVKDSLLTLGTLLFFKQSLILFIIYNFTSSCNLNVVLYRFV